MHIDSYFSLSNTKFEDADFIIFGIPYDSTQSFIPGSRFAPNAIREASWNLEEYSLFFNSDLSLARVCDAGNINVDGGFKNVVDNTADFFKDIDLKRQIPIGLGGEHTITYAILNAIKNRMDVRSIYYIVFDAHFDLRNSFDNNRFNHACITRRIFEMGIENIIQVGVRSGIKEEVDFARRNGITFYYSWEVSKMLIRKIRRTVGNCAVYLSIDLDVFDPAYVNVSTPEPFGLDPKILLYFFKTFDNIFAIDIVEAIPDFNKKTQMLVAKIVFEFIASRLQDP